MSKAFEYELVHESRIYEEVTWEYAINSFFAVDERESGNHQKYSCECGTAVFKAGYVSSYCQKYILRIFCAGE